MEIPVRNTIFLQGVFYSQVKTLEEHMIEDNIAMQEQSNYEPCQRAMNDIRVTRFRNKKQWAEAYKDVTLKCWYCGLSFKGLPCFIPRQIRNTTRGKEFDTHGLFCGFACAFAFLKSQSDFARNNILRDKITMMKMLFIEFYNKKIDEFKEAPCIYDLTSYGGHIDITEYRNILRTLNTTMISDAKQIQKTKIDS